MADERKPQKDETRKAWLHRVYGIGKGAGRGRISAEGHEKLEWAASKGYVFADNTVTVAKAPKAKAAPVAKKKVEMPSEARAVDPNAVRAWARENNIPVGDRGRIKSEITLQYLNAVPEASRSSRTVDEKWVGDGAPRIYPAGTRFRIDFKYKGEPATMVVSDRTACGNCGWSLGWCGCTAPYVATGYGDTNVTPRVTPIYPKGE